jgi:hypothetical protein
MKNQKAKASPRNEPASEPTQEPTKQPNAPQGTGASTSMPSDMVSTAEACEILGMHMRTFRKLRVKIGGIDGARMVCGQWAFPRAAIEAMKLRAEAMQEEDEASPDEGPAAIIRESVRGMEVAIASMKTVLESCVEVVKPLAAQISAARTETNDAHKISLDAVGLVRDLLLEGGKLEADRVVREADQTVRVERTRVAARGLKLLMPLAKAGVSRWLQMPGITKDAQAEGVLELVRDLQREPAKVAELMTILDGPQVEAVQQLLGYAEGAEKLGEALRSLRSRMTGPQMEKLQGMLTSRQLAVLAALFEDEDDEETKNEAKTG